MQMDVLMPIIIYLGLTFIVGLLAYRYTKNRKQGFVTSQALWGGRAFPCPVVF